MAVSLYFGLPGCGKTTLLTKMALDAVKDPRYANVYGNVPLKIFGYTYIDNECIGKYCLENALILIDEASLYADNRDHKNFTKQQVIYFLMHRHFNVDIILFTQQWDGVDRKIRVITDRCYYVYKGLLFGHWFTKYYRVPYGIIIPDPKKGGEKLGEIVQGYCKPNLLIRLFSKSIYRPKYYSYFDSWERPAGFDPLPKSRYHPYIEATEQGELIDTAGAAAAYKKQLRRSERRQQIRQFLDTVHSRFSSVWKKLASKSDLQ